MGLSGFNFPLNSSIDHSFSRSFIGIALSTGQPPGTALDLYIYIYIVSVVNVNTNIQSFNILHIYIHMDISKVYICNYT